MKPKVWLDLTIVPEAMAKLADSAKVIFPGTFDNLPGVDGVILGIDNIADGAFMDRAGAALKVIARHGIGMNNVDIPAASARGILVVNTPDAPTESTAEHAVALIMALAKRVVAGDMSLRGANIPRAQLMGTELRGRTLGVVGVGRIGRRVAEICALGLQMRVMAYNPSLPDWSPLTALGVEPVDRLETLLAQADVVTLHASLTPETRHLMSERRLRLMKPTAYLVNTSRGSLVDEMALARVLAEGHLAGAALDVFDPEPPPPDHPLLRMTHVVVTPHTASYTDLGYQGMGLGAVEQTLQVLRGERPPNLLNPEVWPGRIKVIRV
jgi:D-3-phosphoglycerate dehydrogenase